MGLIERGEKNMILKKWDYEKHKYLDYEVPNNLYFSLYETDMARIVNCPHCLKPFSFGESYTSLEFRNWAGFGLAVCEKCYNEEWERRRKFKGE